MSLDDRTADRQSHAQAAGLGRIEGLEQPVGALGCKPWAGISHLDEHTFRFACSGRYMAERMKAEVKAHAVDHTPSVSAPTAVVDIIRDAIRSVTGN
jgi:hypothetical protein